MVSTAEGIFSSLFLEESSTMLCFWYTEKQFRDVHAHTLFIFFFIIIYYRILTIVIYFIYRERI